MPQDVESASELRNLAAVPWHLISPSNNKSIVGIFQDSLLGAYRFTRQDISFTTRDTMNLLMAYDKVDINKIKRDGNTSSFEIMTQIMHPISMKYKMKHEERQNKDSSKPNLGLKM